MKRDGKVMGLVDLGWSAKVLLPLDLAHKLQTILTEAVGLEREYVSSSRGEYLWLKKYPVPDVSVLDPDAIVFDATMLERKAAGQWRDEVNGGLKNDAEAKIEDCLTPEQWLKLRS